MNGDARAAVKLLPYNHGEVLGLSSGDQTEPLRSD